MIAYNSKKKKKKPFQNDLLFPVSSYSHITLPFPRTHSSVGTPLLEISSNHFFIDSYLILALSNSLIFPVDLCPCVFCRLCYFFQVIINLFVLFLLTMKMQNDFSKVSWTPVVNLTGTCETSSTASAWKCHLS